MVKPLMSDAELRRRKRVQGHLSQVTGGLGLAALGGTLAASRGGRDTLRKIPALKNRIKAPPPKDPNADKIKGAVTPVLATSAGLGGIGSFNFASYTNAESRKRTMTPKPVKKSYGPPNDEPLEMGYYGDEGHPVKLPEIKVPIEKAWEPVAGNFNSEAKRGKRNEAYGTAAQIGAGGAGAYGATHAVRGVKAAKNVPKYTDAARIVNVERKHPATDKKKAYTSTHKIPGKTFVAREVGAFKPALGHGKRAAAGIAVAGGLAAGAKKVKEKHGSSWQPYEKRDATSAFGIDHGPDRSEST